MVNDDFCVYVFSAPAWKKLRGHHFVITHKKLNKLKNQNSYKISQRTEVTGQTAGLRIGDTDRLLQIITT